MDDGMTNGWGNDGWIDGWINGSMGGWIDFSVFAFIEKPSQSLN